MSARIRLTRCFWPPDSSLGYRERRVLREPHERGELRDARAHARASRPAQVPGHEPHVVERGQVREQARQSCTTYPICVRAARSAS